MCGLKGWRWRGLIGLMILLAIMGARAPRHAAASAAPGGPAAPARPLNDHVALTPAGVLRAEPSGRFGGLGRSVALDGDTLAVGDPVGSLEIDELRHGAKVTLFTRSNGAWIQQAILRPAQFRYNDEFGSSVALDGDTLVVGAPGDHGPDRRQLNVGAAYVFARTADGWEQQAVLYGINGVADDRFGTSVAVDGDWIVVGAPAAARENSQGRVSLFARTSQGWQYQHSFTDHEGLYSRYGASVAISGRTIVVGAPWRYGPDDRRIAGKAVVFTQTADQRWQSVTLRPANSAAGDSFGSDVAIAGDTIVASRLAIQGSDAPPALSMAAVFVRGANGWTQEGTLEPNHAAAGFYENLKVAIKGDTIALGYPAYVGEYGLEASGAIYVFTRSAGSWLASATLRSADPSTRDQLGYDVAIGGDTIVGGAPGEYGPANTVPGGAAYVFARSGPAWVQAAVLWSPLEDTGDNLGSSVAADGSVSVVGAPLAPGTNTGRATSGAAYVFTRPATGPTQITVLYGPNPGLGDMFGASVAIDGDTIVVGSPGRWAGTRFEAGEVHVFVRSAGLWSLQATLRAASRDSFDRFGQSVAIAGDTIAVGVPGDDGAANATQNAGSVAIFTRAGGVWTQQIALLPAEVGAMDEFGQSVALSGETLVAGAPGDDGAGNTTEGVGAAYVFARSGGVWQQPEVLRQGSRPGDRVGASVAIDGDMLVVGAPNHEGGIRESIYDAGSAFVYTRSGGAWSFTTHLRPRQADRGAEDHFGASVAIAGGTIAVGAPDEDGHANDSPGSGAAYVFIRTGALWYLHGTLRSPWPTAQDRFGFSVALSGPTMLAGTPGDDGFRSELADAGVAYRFDLP